MVNTIRCGYFSKSKWIDTFKAADVVGENAWIGATLMVGIYAADFAEIVFGRMCIELIQGEQLFTLKDAQTGDRNRRANGTTTTADRTIATPWVFDSIRQAQLNNNPATMANYSVDRTDLNVPDSFEICHFSVNPNAWLRDWTHSALTAHLESFVKLQ